MVSCILLSAGESSRFGSPKALADWHGQPVITHILQTLEMSQVAEIIVVLGSDQDRIKPVLLNHKNAQVVYNKDYKFGQTSSFQAGVREASNQASGFMLWPVDCPSISVETINTLCEVSAADHHQIVIPTHDEKRGHPPIFPAHLKELILDVPRDSGLNSLFQHHTELIQHVAVNDLGVRQTFNTPEEFDQLK